MSHEVETMFSVREKPWHYEMTKDVTKIIQEAPTSKDALIAAGLDWSVVSKPVFDEFQNEIQGYKMNSRSTDGQIMGIVSNKYQIVQNAEAFEFTDALLGEGVRYETAGSLRKGRTIWLLAKMETTKILGDEVEPYLCFTNTHDGTGAVRACMTPVRVVCNNTLNLALNGASTRSWSTPHRGNVLGRIEEARQTLELANNYMQDLSETADRLANESMSDAEVEGVLDTMFELPEDATDRQKKNAEEQKSQIVMCMMRPDIAKFLNTKWGFINAVADHVDHSEPLRKTQNFEENRWGSIIVGHPLLDKAFSLVR